MFVLMTQNNTGIRGVYDNELALSEAVDYWSKMFPNDTLAYEEWDTNYIPEASSWEWVYIAPNSDPKILGAGGGSVPLPIYWGRNLVGVEFESIPGFGDWE